MKTLKKFTILLVIFVLCMPLNAQRRNTLPADVLATMKKATTFMVEKVSNNGGFLWSYAPDFSRMWGELEAKPSMIWIEPPGTPAMGHIFLDAYHLTGDEYYYQAAEAAARALIWGQLPCGGWNYLIDFAGEASLKDWHKQIYAGYNWPAYEHQYYQGNATFDDDGTIMAAELLLRMYLESYDPVYKPALDKAINFVLESQYPIGGWPQRYPLRSTSEGDPDYTAYITINDGVHTNNINFLITCHQTLGLQSVIDPITRAMTCILALQGGNPQAGWGLQHDLSLDLLPAGARPFEPAGYASHGTAEMIQNLLYFYRLTGNTKYMARIPDAFAFLESIAIPESEWGDFEERRRPRREGQILCPTFVEIGTNKGLYLKRTPGDIRTGHYYVDYDRTNLITHYSSVRTVDLAALKAEYQELMNTPVEELTRNSPLKSTTLTEYPKYYSRWTNGASTEENVRRIVGELQNKSYWPGPLQGVASEYVGFGPNRLPDEVISCWSYIRNMTTLMNYLK
ncbi:MAG: pectate lyase [Bacteroidales bacterium]|nr:pectate lyase [Bacteroidales bacterium]